MKEIPQGVVRAQEYLGGAPRSHASSGVETTVTREVQRINDEISAFTKQARADIKSHGGKIDEVRAELRVAEQAIAEIRQGGGYRDAGSVMVAIGGLAVAAFQEDDVFLQASTAAQRGMKPGQFNARINLDGQIRAALTNTGGTSSDGYSVPSQPERGRILGPVAPQLRLLDVLPSRRTTSDAVEFIQISVAAGGAAEQLVEGDPKNELNLDGVLERADIVTVAGWTAASKQVLSDHPALAQVIDSVLRQKVLARLEHQIINGPGGQGKINGLLDLAAVLVPTIGTTPADIIGEALVRMADNGYRPNLVLLNPLDWFRIQLTRTNTEGQYVFGSPSVPVPPSLWNVAIVVTPSVPEGTGLTVDTSYVTVLDREQMSVSVTNSHADFFVRNLVAVLCELRAGLEVINEFAVLQFDLEMASES